MFQNPTQNFPKLRFRPYLRLKEKKCSVFQNCGAHVHCVVLRFPVFWNLASKSPVFRLPNHSCSKSMCFEICLWCYSLLSPLFLSVSSLHLFLLLFLLESDRTYLFFSILNTRHASHATTLSHTTYHDIHFDHKLSLDYSEHLSLLLCHNKWQHLWSQPVTHS